MGDISTLPLVTIRCYVVDGNKTLVIYNSQTRQWICQNDLTNALAVGVSAGNLVLGGAFAPSQPQSYEFSAANNECVLLHGDIVVGTGDIRHVTGQPTDFRFFDLNKSAVQFLYINGKLKITYDAGVDGSLITSPYTASNPCV